MGLFMFLLQSLLYLVPVVEDIFGLVYPILATAKSVIQEDTEAASKWLTYWTVYSVFVLFESSCEWLISWMPLYHECKLLFVCWLVLPRFEGAAKIYEILVIPYFLEYEEQIDERLSEASIEAKRHLSTFVVYLVTEGSRIAGEKTMGGISLFLRLTGFSSILDEKDQVNENTIYAVAHVVGNVITDHIPEEEEEEKENEIDKKDTHLIQDELKKGKKYKSPKQNKEEKEENLKMKELRSSIRVPQSETKPNEEEEGKEGEGEEKGDGDCSKQDHDGIGDPNEAVEGEEDEDDDVMLHKRDNELDDNELDGKVRNELDENELDVAMEGMDGDEARDLLEDFLSVIEDGIYLNVSTTQPDSSPRLRIVTLSINRWRLLWSNLRQKGNTSSLHLATVSSIDTRPLCISLVSNLEPKVVSFEAQGDEVHDVLSEGLRLLVGHVREKAKQVLMPSFDVFSKRLMKIAFQNLKISRARSRNSDGEEFASEQKSEFKNEGSSPSNVTLRRRRQKNMQTIDF